MFVDSAKAFLTSSFMKVVYMIVGAVIAAFILMVIILNASKKKSRRVKYVPLSRNERDEINRDNDDFKR